MTIPNNLLSRLPANNLINQIIPKFGEERVGKFTTLVFTLTACACFGLFAISPTLSTIAQLQRELSDQQGINQQLDTKLANLFALQKEYPIVQQTLPLALQAIPSAPDTLQLVGLLQGLAKQDNVTLTQLQIFPVEISQTQSTKPLSYIFVVGTEGTYADSVIFLTHITNFNRIVTIDSLSLASDINDQFRTTVKGEAYAQKSL